MNAQLHSITGQMVPLMEHYVVHPKVTVAQWCEPPCVHQQLPSSCCLTGKPQCSYTNWFVQAVDQQTAPGTHHL